MACEALETIVKSCDNNSGGIEKIWINKLGWSLDFI